MTGSDKIIGPDFLCIGARKTGTTWMYAFLRKHPSCYMPRIKEINFFNSALFNAPPGKAPAKALESKWAEIRTRKQLPADTPIPEEWLKNPLRWYLQTYARQLGIVSGDVSPLYQDIPAARIPAIHAAIPNAKIIYILRHPLERVVSDFSMLTNNRGIDVAALSDDECLQLLRTHYATSIRYTDVYQRWQAHFPVTVMWYEELRADPVAFAGELCEILDIAPMPELAREISNPNPSKSYGPRPKLSPAVHKGLAHMLLPEALATDTQFANEWTRSWLADITAAANA